MTALVPAEYVMDVDSARRLTERIRLTAFTVRDGMEKMQVLVDEAKSGNAHVALGYPSWTAYLADTLGSEPLRLPRDQRQEMVGYLAGEGMSTRAIAPIVGASQATVARAVRAPESFDSPAPTVAPVAPTVDLATVDLTTGEIHEPITGLDGKTYTRPEPVAPRATQRRSLVDTARDAGQELRKATERLERIAADDRLTRNKEEVAAHLRHHLNRAIEVCQDLDNLLNNH